MKAVMKIGRALLAGMLLLAMGHPVYAEEPAEVSPPPVGEPAADVSEEPAETAPAQEALTEETEPLDAEAAAAEQSETESEAPAEKEEITEALDPEDPETEPSEERAEPETPEPADVEEAVQEAEPEQTEKPETPEPSEEPAPAESEDVTWTERLIVIGGEIRETDHVISSYDDLTLLGFADADALEEGLAYYSKNAAHAEADGVILAAENGNLTDAPNEISSENNPIDQLQQLLEEEEPVTPGKAPLIALIDTGAPQDRNGIVSAVSVLGDDPSDDNGHGTRMSALILAENPSAKILSIKALDAAGSGTMSSVFAAMEYAIEQGADMIALCMSAYVSSENRIIADEIEKAAANGITVVGSAGNNHLNTKYFVPANCASAVIAGSCDETGELRSFTNWGDTVDALVVSDSTSEAAAILCGILSANGKDLSAAFADRRVFSKTGNPEEGGETEPPAEDDGQFSAQCNSFFYGDAYFWEIPYGETTTKNAKLIAGYQQEILNAQTDFANGYGVQFQEAADAEFAPGHGYAVFSSTHKPNAVSGWGSDVYEDEFRGSYEAYGKEFDSEKTFIINAKIIPDFSYLGVVVSQNSIEQPGERSVGELSPDVSVSARLGHIDSVLWQDVPGMNSDYWEGWDHTSGGEEFDSFRVDFYYQNARPKHNLTIRYLEEKTEKVLAKQHGPVTLWKDDSYSVSSPGVPEYELVNPKDAVIAGTMPDHDVVYTVYYRRIHKILTKVINGKITLNNAMEKAGTVGDDTWQASGSVTGIHNGENRTIRYENKPKHLLDYVKVDGKPVDIQKYPKAYPFSGITADHQVEVKYVPEPTTDDAKKVQRADGTYIDGKMVTAGEVLTYSIRLKNHFSTTQTFAVEDRIPERTAYADGSANENGRFENGILKWNFQLGSGAEKILTFRVSVLPAAKGTIVKNKADVLLNGMKFTTNETVNPVLPDPVKRVENSDGEDLNEQLVPVEKEVIYRITVKNPADTAQAFTITDPVDDRQTAVTSSISDGGSLNGSLITWKITVPAGKEYTVSFAAKPKDYDLTIPNKAGVTSGGCPTVETNRTVIYTPVKPVKTVTTAGGTEIDGKAIAQNEEFVYWITVKNPCPSEKQCVITDNIPDAVQIIDAGMFKERFETGGAGAEISGQTVTWKSVLPGMQEMKCYVRCRLKETNVEFVNHADVLMNNIELKTNEVSNWAGRIIINAEINEYWEPYGQPSFLYDIQDSTGRMWHRMILIDPASRKGQAVFDIPTGHDADTWTIRDEPGSRYRFIQADPETNNVTVSGNVSSAVIAPETNLGITHYLYGIRDWNDTSHLAAVVNALEYQRS